MATKLELINALNEKTTALNLRKEQLLDKVFDLVKQTENQINELKKSNLIDCSKWKVQWDNNILYYCGKCIDYTCYERFKNISYVLDFCKDSNIIIEEMQKELENKLNELEEL